jgi:hypothetical protein
VLRFAPADAAALSRMLFVIVVPAIGAYFMDVDGQVEFRNLD